MFCKDAEIEPIPNEEVMWRPSDEDTQPLLFEEDERPYGVEGLGVASSVSSRAGRR